MLAKLWSGNEVKSCNHTLRHSPAGVRSPLFKLAACPASVQQDAEELISATDRGT
jgi:hypothetical protein